MLRPQDTSSAPEGEYLATAGAATRIQASTDPDYHVVQVRGRPYLLPVLQELPQELPQALDWLWAQRPESSLLFRCRQECPSW